MSNPEYDDVYYFINSTIYVDEDIIHMRYYLSLDLEKVQKQKKMKKRVR